jgi:hypothetical protein
LHDGIEALEKWHKGSKYNEESHIVKMIKDAANAVLMLGSSILLLDRLFLTVPMLEAAQKVPGLSVVTKAKSNAVAYYKPGPYKGRGANKKKGEKIKLIELFEEKVSEFVEATLTLYGKEKVVKYFCIDLLWGKKLYMPLRFVLTIIDGTYSFLVSTDLTMLPTDIIRLYSRRFKIECAFRELKQVVAGFSYHFWNKVMPKLQKFKKNEVNEAILFNVIDSRKRRLIEATVKAIEGFVQISVIALGMLQMISLHFGDEINRNNRRFMRTITNTTPSERTVADFIRKNIYVFLIYFPNLAMTTLIKKRQEPPIVYDMDKTA